LNVLRKKTYVFDEDTLNILKTLREELGKKETQIIKEALRLYFDNHREQVDFMKSLGNLMERIERVVKQVSQLSYRLGRCEERNRILEEELRRFRSGYENG